KLYRNQEVAERVYTIIEQEYQRTIREILDVSGLDQLMAETPAIALSIHRRDPYLDPLNHIQITLLERTRNNTNDEESEDERNLWMDPLLRSINAIAAGMRNTG
ncbi:MAG: phosphoenolpyruvate carboxylase, partial [Halothiobacillaceae bacterium]